MNTSNDQSMRHRILAVDDEEPILFALKEYFTHLRYEMDCAKDKQEAEEFLTGTRYGLVILDLCLGSIGGMEGFELLGKVRERNPDAKIIILTGYGGADFETFARQRQVDAFLHKPQTLAEVGTIVSTLLDRQEREIKGPLL